MKNIALTFAFTLIGVVAYNYYTANNSQSFFTVSPS